MFVGLAAAICKDAYPNGVQMDSSGARLSSESLPSIPLCLTIVSTGVGAIVWNQACKAYGPIDNPRDWDWFNAQTDNCYVANDRCNDQIINFCVRCVYYRLKCVLTCKNSVTTMFSFEPCLSQHHFFAPQDNITVWSTWVLLDLRSKWHPTLKLYVEDCYRWTVFSQR